MTAITPRPTLEHSLRSGGFTGELIDANHPEYHQARKVWSGTVDRRPLAIARCHDAEDVSSAVTLAAEQKLPLAVRCGGHSAAGHSTCDGGLVIDLSPMHHVTVDPDTRRARVGGGALLGQLDQATQQHGLAVPAGQVSHTGVGGLTLGGGVGYLMRQLGLTIDSLTGAQVVTASGEVVRADEHTNADLFWALRGGGGNFGVVTEFEFRLHEVGPIITAGVLVFPFTRAKEILQASRELMARASKDLSIHEILISIPSHDPFPQALHGQPAVFLVPAHLGTPEEAAAELAPLRALGPTLDMVGPMPYVALQTMIDWDTRHGLGTYTKSHWLNGFEDDLIDTLVELFPQAPSPLAHIVTARMGGAIEQVPAQATAFAHRRAKNLMWVIDLWEDPSEDIEPHRDWVNGLLAATAHHSRGVYVNALESDEVATRTQSAYNQATFERLRQVKRRWDPDNLFRLNANIPPTGPDEKP
jgi:FAD/FMN-containing dehydrogenase